MGFQEYPKLSSELHAALGAQAPRAPTATRVLVGSATVPFRPEWDRHALTPRHTAYLRVAEGCDHKCTFCAIPSFRGKFRSKPWDAVLDEAQRLAASGVRELNLIAEDTNQYGQDFPKSDGRGLAQLLAALAAIPGIEWIRILYAYPSYFTEDLIDAIATIPQVVKYIDIPLQHISNTTLLAMNRPPRQHTEALLRKLRDRIPGLALRSTFICGFPGEREQDHRELVDFCKEFKFERLGAFTFSEEDGTPAGSYPEQIDPDVREARRDEIVSLQQRICERVAERRVGSVVQVLVDAIDEEGVFVGRTALEAPDVDPCVFLHDAGLPGVLPLAIGQMRLCKVDGSSMFDLTAHPIE
jgi:ribosomal protein S12 methylthiotransferase